MIVDLHAHAMSEQFLLDLEKNPVEGLKAERNAAGGFVLRRVWDERQSMFDPHLFDLQRRLESLRSRGVERNFRRAYPRDLQAAWP